MIIWNTTIGEPLPIPGNNDRLHRAGLLNNELLKHGANIVWWASTFNHFSKKYYFTNRKSLKVKDHYNLADCFAMPGYGEGFGIVYLEAMACGIPTVGSKLDGSKEALLNGRLGELVHPQNSNELMNAILKCIKKPIRVNPKLEFFSEQNFQKRIIEKIHRELGFS